MHGYKMKTFLHGLFFLMLLYSGKQCPAAKRVDVSEIDPNMSVTPVNLDNIDWYSPDEAPFRLLGFKWFEKDGIYRRLPVDSPHKLSPKVEILANATSGGQIHFKTDSPRVLVKVKLPNNNPLYHMTQVAKIGFDVYTGPPGDKRFMGVSRFHYDTLEYVAQLTRNPIDGISEFTINFPLYNGVDEILIGLEADSRILPPSPLVSNKPIVIYGTSITHGSSASRPGMSYPNILSRMLNMEVVNLGFSGAGRGELEIARLINEIQDKSLVILDFECNTHEQLFDVLEPFIAELRKADEVTPVLVISRIELVRDNFADWKIRKPKLLDFQRNLITRLAKEGDENIHFLDGAKLLDDDFGHEATVDGTHPTDVGFLMMARNLESAIRELLR